jgi:putative salt-induced outer membrane protein
LFFNTQAESFGALPARLRFGAAIGHFSPPRNPTPAVPASGNFCPLGTLNEHQKAMTPSWLITSILERIRIVKKTILALAVGFASAGSFAYAQTDLTGLTSLNDRIDDIQDDVNEDLARGEDPNRFGNPEFNTGLSGSASLGYSGQTGANESQELLIGARMRHSTGQFVQTIGLALEFTDEDGSPTSEDVFGVYDANYYFNDRFYGFVLGRIETDGLADEAAIPGEAVGTDAFIGFGPGYRVINTDQVTWRVQAGIGQSYQEYGDGTSETELTYIASSRLFYGFNENVFASMDTDVLSSDTALRVNNDLGVSVRMSDNLSTRVSYLTEYNDSEAIRTDNRLGVSLVMGF